LSTRPGRARARGLAVIALLALVVSVTAVVVTSAAARQFVVYPPAPVSVVPSMFPSPFPSPTATRTTPALSKVHVVAIGDSVTAGTNCNCTPFPELYAKGLADSYDIRAYVQNDGTGGETSADVLADLTSDPGERDDIAQADIVVVTIGANDFGSHYNDIASGTCDRSDRLGCVHDQLGQLQDNLDEIVQRIRRLRGGAPTAILLTGYWNVFEDGDVAVLSMSKQGRAASDTLTIATNRIIQQVADADHATYVDLYAPFKGPDGSANPTDLLAGDGDHPNAAGHQVIARTLLKAGTLPLRLA
jgi:lysophospholipase L1-like esterase